MIKNIFRKAGNIYTLIATNLLTVVIIFLLINLAAKLYLHRNEKQISLQGSHIDVYGKEKMHKAFEKWRPEEVDEFVPTNGKYEYEPFTQYKHSATEGKYISVSEHGFRKNGENQMWPPNKRTTIFIFGGSTTFGFTRDSETIPAHIQKILHEKYGLKDVTVYNFGRVGYFSSQERVLFENLMLKNFVPSLAIFLDGLNDFTLYDGNPDWTRNLSRLVNKNRNKEELFRSSLSNVWEGLSISLFLKQQKRTKPELPYSEIPLNDESAWSPKVYGDPEIIRSCVERMFNNHKMIRAIAKVYGVQPLFVLQPVPTYKYDLKHHLFYLGNPAIFREAQRSYFGYRELSQQKNRLARETDFLWLADIQKDVEKNLYVDIVHYTDEFSQMIAEKIAEEIFRKKIFSIASK